MNVQYISSNVLQELVELDRKRFGTSVPIEKYFKNHYGASINSQIPNNDKLEHIRRRIDNATNQISILFNICYNLKTSLEKLIINKDSKLTKQFLKKIVNEINKRIDDLNRDRKTLVYVNPAHKDTNLLIDSYETRIIPSKSFYILEIMKRIKECPNANDEMINNYETNAITLNTFVGSLKYLLTLTPTNTYKKK